MLDAHSNANFKSRDGAHEALKITASGRDSTHTPPIASTADKQQLTGGDDDFRFTMACLTTESGASQSAV